MIKIYCHNQTLIITDTCPREFAECAIRCLDTRKPKRQEQVYDDEHNMYIPRYSKFIGQLGRVRA